MNDKTCASKFHKRVRCKGSNDGFKVRHNQHFELSVRDISSGNEEQPFWLLSDEKGTHKIGIFRDDDATFTSSDSYDTDIRRAVSRRKIQRMDGIMTRRGQATSQPAWKLGVNKTFHAASDSIRLTWLRRAANANTARRSSRSRSS